MKNKLSRRDFLRMSSVATAGTVLAACAPAQSGDSASSTSSDAPSSEPVELSLSIVDFVDETKAVLEDDIFPGYEDATITVNYTAWNRYNEEMTTAFAGGVTPDLFQGGAVWAPQMAKRGWSLALDDYIAGAGDWGWDDWFPALQDDATIDGKVVAVPYRFDIRSLWYRSDQLQAAGFDSPPTNWEELREIAIATTQRDGDKITVEGLHYSGPGGWQNDLQPYMYFMEMADGTFLSEDLSTCTLDSDACIEAMEFIHQLIVKDQVQPYPGFENQGDLEPIVAGTAAMTFSSTGPERIASQYAPDELDHLQVSLPLTHKVQATHVWINKWFVSSLSKQPDQTWDLLTYLTNVENQEKYSASGQYQPPRQSLGDADFLTDRAKVLFESTNYARPYPKHWRLIELFRPFAQELELCLSGQKSPAETMTATCEAINAILAEDA